MNCNSKVKEENEGYMQVAIRIKPLDGNKKTCLQYIPDSNQIEVNKEYGTENFKRYFSFDYIFGPSTTQETIYNQLCPPLINHFLDGINITVFAYGQTGTGKTYTMGSETSSLNPEESIGIIPRVIQGLYNGIEQKKKENNEIEYVVKITFIEIYQEQLRDLLHPDTLSKDINIWENNNCITVSGVQEEIVNNLDEILTYIEQGTVARMTGTTNVHLHSSRSHAIFTIILEQYLKQRSKENNNNNVFESINNMQNSNLIRMSKFHLVDLAGSERVKKTGAEGLRLKESVKINSGLLALGNVISSLSMESSNNNNSNNNEKYIPYRDSKLTRLLQDSLGGNSKTMMIACISSANEDCDESLNTLKYAQRARKIKNKPIINNINIQALKILTMKQKIEELENKLNQTNIENNESNNKSNSNFNMNGEYDDEEWLKLFINEFKNRTAKRSNAIKELNDLKEENEKILNELNQIKEENELREQNKEKIKEENINLNKEIEILNYHNNEMINDLNNLSYYSNSIANNIALSAEQKDQFNTIVSKWINYENNHLLNENHKNGYNNNENMKAPPNTAQSIINENTNTISEQDFQIIESQKNIIKKLEEESVHDNQMLDQYKQDIKNLQEKLTLVSRSIEINNGKIKELEKIKSELEMENESLKDNNNKLQKKIYSVESMISKSSIKTENNNNNNNNDNNKNENSLNKSNEDQKELEEIPQKEGIMLELDMAIKAKVELTRELTKISKEFEKSKHYLSNEIQKLERELENSKGELIKVQNQSQDKDNQRDKMKEEYEKKLKIFENQLIKSRARQKGYDKIKKDNSLLDRKNQKLKGEIEKMTNLLSIYKKKTKDDSEKLSEVEVRKSKEIALLQKQIEDGTKQLRQQEVKMEMLRKKLDRKIEENNSLSKKLKDHIILYDNNNGNKYSKKNKKQPKSINSSNETTSNNDDTSSNNKIENNNNKNDNKDNNNSQKNFDINSSKETKNQNKETNNVLKKSKIAKINLNKIKLSSTLSFTIHEIKRRLFVVNDALDEKKNELNKLSNEEKEEKKVCSLIIESLNKEKDLLTNQLEQIQKKNNVIYKTKEVQTDEDKSNNIYHEIFDDKQKEELEDYIETLENERLQLNERLNNIISDHNREINELKKLYEQKLCHSQNKLDEEMKDSNDESLHEKEIIKLLKKNNQEYMNKISQLEQNNKFFKEKQKDLKKKLREFANENNHLIGIVNKEKVKNSKLKNYIQNVLNNKKEMEGELLSNNTINSNNDISNNNINNNVNDNDVTNNYNNDSNELTDKLFTHKIKNQDKFSKKQNIQSTECKYSVDSNANNKLSVDNNDISNNNNNSNNNNDYNNNKDTHTIDSDGQERPIKASRKSLRSSNSESTIVPSEGEMTVNTSISDLTNCDKDSHHQMNSSSQFSLPVICIKDTDNNSIVKAKDINICSKNDGSSCMSSDNNINITNSKNPLEKQNNSILNTNDFLPSILNKK